MTTISFVSCHTRNQVRQAESQKDEQLCEVFQCPLGRLLLGLEICTRLPIQGSLDTQQGRLLGSTSQWKWHLQHELNAYGMGILRVKDAVGILRTEDSMEEPP